MPPRTGSHWLPLLGRHTERAMIEQAKMLRAEDIAAAAHFLVSASSSLNSDGSCLVKLKHDLPCILSRREALMPSRSSGFS